MTQATPQQSSCLCGAVTISANIGHTVGACHCDMCRKWGGGPYMTIDGSEVEIVGDAFTAFDSSEWAQRGFCNQCGTHLFYRLKSNQQYFLPVGLFGGNDALVFEHQVFIDEKPAFYAFANDTQDMTGAEVFAQFGGQSD